MTKEEVRQAIFDRIDERRATNSPLFGWGICQGRTNCYDCPFSGSWGAQCTVEKEYAKYKNMQKNLEFIKKL